MGRNACAGCCVGVLTGKSKESELTQTDVIVNSVADIRVR